MNGIKAFLKDKSTGAIAPCYVTPARAGAVEVVVPESQLEKAVHIMGGYFVRSTAQHSVLSMGFSEGTRKGVEVWLEYSKA